MGNINISGRMARKTTVRDLNGGIIDLMDESDGGWIIRGRRVVNQEKYDALLQKEKDKREAALAATKAISNPQASEARNAPANQSNKVADLEKKVEDMGNKLDAILQAITGKK